MRRLTLALIAIAGLAGLGWAALTYLPKTGKPPPRPESPGYFFRQIAKLSHKGEPITLDVVVSCSGKLVKRFGAGAVTTAPGFYILRVKQKHAVGLRPTSGCGGATSFNNGVPWDLLPAIYWFPDADKLDFSVLYVSEDAYANPLSELTFHGSTMQSATPEDFLAFQERAETESLIPLTKQGYGGGGAMRYHTLSEKGRALLAKYWPAHKPRYWTIGPRHPLHADLNRHSSVILEKGRPSDYGWELYLPNVDGFPTRAGGGALNWPPAARPVRRLVPDLYPYTTPAAPAPYRDPSKDPDFPMWLRIEKNGDRAKGFAYRQDLPRRSASKEEFKLYVDDVEVDMSLWDFDIGKPGWDWVPRVLERDQAYFIHASYQ